MIYRNSTFVHGSSAHICKSYVHIMKLAVNSSKLGIFEVLLYEPCDSNYNCKLCVYTRFPFYSFVIVVYSSCNMTIIVGCMVITVVEICLL